MARTGALAFLFVTGLIAHYSAFAVNCSTSVIPSLGGYECTDLLEDQSIGWCSWHVCMHWGDSTEGPWDEYAPARADAEEGVEWYYGEGTGKEICEMSVVSEDPDWHGGAPGGCELPTCGFRNTVFNVVNKPAGAPDTECNSFNYAAEVKLSVYRYCPPGYSRSGDICYRTPALQCPEVNNPVAATVGFKIQRETDFPATPHGLKFARTYNVWNIDPSGTFSDPDFEPAPSWFHTYYRKFVTDGTADPLYVTLTRGNGERQTFIKSGSDYIANADARYSLTAIRDTGGTILEWHYVDRNDTLEVYDVDGLMLVLEPTDGRSITFTYSNSGTSPNIAPRAGLLLEATDITGRSLSFEYDGNALIDKMTDPNGQVYLYTNNGFGLLTSVEYPDGTVRAYSYGAPGVSRALVGITDEKGNLYATYTYDGFGRIRSSENAGGVNRKDYTYQGSGYGVRSSTTMIVTDELGQQRTYRSRKKAGVLRLTSVSNPCSSCGAGGAETIGYDSNGNVNKRVDFNGNETRYTHDSGRNLEISRTEAYGSPESRTITTTWHNGFRKPTLITEAGKTTAFTYNARGQALTRTETDTANSNTRSWSYTYCEAAGVTAGTCPYEGALLTVDGPRVDVSDVTTYDYYLSAGTGFADGDLDTITNALGHVTKYLSYDDSGRPLQIQDPNGVVTALTYHPRGWLASSTIDGQSTSFAYDVAGLLTRITQPTGAFVDYEYDAAHRLVAMEDNFGNRVEYTLDAAGNRTVEETRDAGGALRHKVSRLYSQLGHMVQLIDGINNATQFSYDGTGNQLSTTDPRGNATAHSYDALNRLIKITDPFTSTQNLNAVASDALLAAYPFEGTLDDDSGAANHGVTASGAVAYTPGPNGLAARLTSGTAIDIGEMNAFEGLDEWSISAWIRIDDLS
ncbi:MAG: hypothetical protein QNJ40_26380, partial [Xanthomonadales bacterium]|nr:hypothetical protein [Xanthomonadales bacterium]